jgi:hypothetical protein
MLSGHSHAAPSVSCMPMHPFDLFARASSSAPPPGHACVAVDFRVTRRSAALNLVRLRDNQRASKTLDFRPTAARMSPGPQRHWQLHAGGTRATALPTCRDLLLLCRSIAGEAATRGRACTPPAIQPVPHIQESGGSNGAGLLHTKGGAHFMEQLLRTLVRIEPQPFLVLQPAAHLHK